MPREIKRLGDLLVESGKITEKELEEALKKQKVTEKRLGEILIDEGYISEEDIIDILEIQLGIQRVYLDFININYKLTKLVPENLARKYILVPVALSGDKIEIAMADPLNIFAQDDVRISSGYEVKPLIATNDEIIKFIDKIYSGEKVEKAAQEFTKEHNLKIEKEDNQHLEDTDINRAPIVKIVDLVLSDAINSSSSDIHIEPFDHYIKIRYRIDGMLIEKKKLPIESLAPLTTRIKILSNLDIAEKRMPQDGRMKVKVGDEDIDLRISTLPTIHGEKIVIRILRSNSANISKENLGMDKDNIEKLEKIIKSPYGIILVTGPTGSGKSTTLYAILSELNSNDRNIITVEDPVEYVLEGVNQVNVNIKAGLTFAAGLRSILRQDPDIVMIGEMRDAETAEISVRAAITGHLVLSTIHTNDAASSIVRLVDMGVEPYLVASAVTGIIAQRLVRKICPYCEQEYQASNYEKEILGIKEIEGLKLKKGKGCPRCNGTGYLGRMGVYEIMEITQKHKELIMNSGSTEDLKSLSTENGMKTIRSSCENLVLSGKTTVEELLKIALVKE
ncbi:GspE/PulE family protein [Clostridium akagii]|uniref:GspE/PulE family protein n=1 Tax=Clostridium akagii TaxID=91623 RepID=UPI00047B7FB6|nr:ATPase, T2SS/T4P/T4SS family [Clostridium akagii]